MHAIEPPTRATGMKQYEYMEYCYKTKREGLEALRPQNLNDLGAQGWLLLSAYSESSWRYITLFVREVINPAN